MSSYHKHYKPQELSGICVVRRKGEEFEDLMKRFRKKFSKSGLSREFRERMFYEKPSDKKRRKKAQSIRLLQREAEKAEQMRERFIRMKEKEKAKRQKEYNKYKGDQNDKSGQRQNRSRIPKKNYKQSGNSDS